MQIRALDPARGEDLERVAQGMRATLIEVEGEVTGTALYDMDWLRGRALQHAQASDWPAVVLLAVNADEQILGHTLVREDPPGEGLVSTTYVWPDARRRGVAAALLQAGEAWMRARGLGFSSTWTSATNAPLIRLYEGSGYAVAAHHVHESTGTPMLQLRRSLLSPSP